MDNQELVVYCNFTDKEVVCDEEDLLDSAEILISNYDVHQKAKLKAYEAIVYIQNKIIFLYKNEE